MAVPLSAVAAISPKIQARIENSPLVLVPAPDGVAKWQVCKMARAQPQVKGANTASDAEQPAKCRRRLALCEKGGRLQSRVGTGGPHASPFGLALLVAPGAGAGRAARPCRRALAFR